MINCSLTYAVLGVPATVVPEDVGVDAVRHAEGGLVHRTLSQMNDAGGGLHLRVAEHSQ